MPFQKVVTHCLQCGKEIITTQNRIDDGRGRFCSRGCCAKFTHTGRPKPPLTAEHKRLLGESHRGVPAWNKGELVRVVCEICGKECEIWPNRVRTFRYCSYECAYEAKRRVTGTNHPLWTRQKRYCEWCGKEVWVKPAKLDEFRYCSRKCTGTAISYQMAMNKGPTSIEKALMDELDRLQIPYRWQHKIATWLIDITLPQYRIAIEADGDYWHASEQQKAKDANKDRWLKAHAWRVFRFSETDIRRSPSECLSRIPELAKLRNGS